MNIFERYNTLLEAVDRAEDVGNADLVILPPDTDGYLTDEEAGDDDIGMAGNINLPADVPGSVEVHHEEDDEDTEIEESGTERLIL